jgi:hypothetical protein
MTRSGLLLGAALALTVTAVGAENVHSANYMLPYCRNWIDRKLADPFNQGLCAGLVEGIAVTGGFVILYALPSDYDKPEPHLRDLQRELCINAPDDATIEQMVRVVVAYIDARPARMHEDFRNLAREALRTAWPCR